MVEAGKEFGVEWLTNLFGPWGHMVGVTLGRVGFWCQFAGLEGIL